MRKSIPIAASAIAITFLAASPSFAFLSTVRSLISQYLPIAEEHLNRFLEPILGEDYNTIVGGILTDGFESVISGRGLNESILRRGIPDLAAQASDDTGVPVGIFSQGGEAILSRDIDKAINAGVDYLDHRYGNNTQPRPPARFPNGTNTGQIPGAPPTSSGEPEYDDNGNEIETTAPGPPVDQNGTTVSGLPQYPGIPIPQTVAEPGPIGNASCAYTTTCTGALPARFVEIFTNAKGALGIVDPIQVRGKTFEMASEGIAADAFAVNPFSSANHTANNNDRELTRASTQRYLSVDAQEASRERKENTAQLLESKRKLVEEGLEAQSSQNVLKAMLSSTSMLPELSSAQLELQREQLEDNQYNKLNLANISEQVDWQRRSRDAELASQSYYSLYAGFSKSLPSAPEGTPDIFR